MNDFDWGYLAGRLAGLADLTDLVCKRMTGKSPQEWEEEEKAKNNQNKVS